MPVHAPAWVMQTLCDQSKSVYEPFCGSGTTLIAAEQTGRHAFLMELDTLYCDVIVQRWEKFTGRKAQRITAAGAPGTDMPEKTPDASAGVSKAGKK
jgi:DNA modification methylase